MDEEFYEYHCPCGFPKDNDGSCTEDTPVHPNPDCPCYTG